MLGRDPRERLQQQVEPFFWHKAANGDKGFLVSRCPIIIRN
jgi:hypothetical protein